MTRPRHPSINYPQFDWFILMGKILVETGEQTDAETGAKTGENAVEVESRDDEASERWIFLEDPTREKVSVTSSSLKEKSRQVVGVMHDKLSQDQSIASRGGYRKGPFYFQRMTADTCTACTRTLDQASPRCASCWQMSPRQRSPKWPRSMASWSPWPWSTKGCDGCCCE